MYIVLFNTQILKIGERFIVTGKEILSVSICEPDPFILQIGFSAKKILQEFAVDMLTHMFQYLHDLGRITHYDMTQQIAQQIAQVQLGI